MKISRTDQSLLAQWWFTVDRVLLGAVLLLIGAGLILSLAASPAMAVKRGLPVFHYAQRHAVFAILAASLVVSLSWLGPRSVRRVSLITLGVMLAMLVGVLWLGPEINGARRWLRFAGHSIQPSELAKPAFVIVSAWLFSESQQRPGMPAIPMAIGLYAVFATLLVLQPQGADARGKARGGNGGVQGAVPLSGDPTGDGGGVAGAGRGLCACRIHVALHRLCAGRSSSAFQVIWNVSHSLHTPLMASHQRDFRRSSSWAR